MIRAMATLVATAARQLFRREMFPPRVLWWLAAEGMRDWFALLARELPPGKPAMRAIGARMFRRRYDVLAATHARLPRRGEDPRAVALLMGGLYRVASDPDAEWIFDDLGGAPRTLLDHLRAERLMKDMPVSDRWSEVTTHLGELLIASTDDLPRSMPRARPVLGEICFRAGERFARRMKKQLGLSERACREEAPALAIEVLRMSEYLFRVNPDHWGEDDGKTKRGWLEGTACPWYTAPGWNGAHCGIFGQFQSGVSAAFGLRYHLSKTIPKHGGGTCRVDLAPIDEPIRLRKKEARE